jgi:hypothetical protein
LPPENTLPGSRPDIIRAVNTPLGFFSLVVLVVEAILGLVAATSSDTGRAITIAVMLAVIIALVAIVAYFAYHRPEALFGQRHQEHVSIDTEQLTTPLKNEIQRLTESNQLLVRKNRHLDAQLEAVKSVRLQILSVLGAESASSDMLVQRIVATNDPGGRTIVMSALGELVHDGTIEQDTMRGGAYYRLRKTKP